MVIGVGSDITNVSSYVHPLSSSMDRLNVPLQISVISNPDPIITPSPLVHSITGLGPDKVISMVTLPSTVLRHSTTMATTFLLSKVTTVA